MSLKKLEFHQTSTLLERGGKVTTSLALVFLNFTKYQLMKSARKGRETQQLCSGTRFSTVPPIEINSDSYTFKFRCVMFYFLGTAVSEGEKSRDESSERVDSDEEADGSGSEHNEPETQNTRDWSKLILQ